RLSVFLLRLPPSTTLTLFPYTTLFRSNPRYVRTFVFENDFAALKPEIAPDRIDIQNRGLLVAEGEPGICRVICFSPRHDLTLSTDRKSTRLNSSHRTISYAVFCLKKKK